MLEEQNSATPVGPCINAPEQEEQNSAVLEHAPDTHAQHPVNSVEGLETVAAVQDQHQVHIPEIPSVWIHVKQDVQPSTTPHEAHGSG